MANDVFCEAQARVTKFEGKGDDIFMKNETENDLSDSIG